MTKPLTPDRVRALMAEMGTTIKPGISISAKAFKARARDKARVRVWRNAK